MNSYRELARFERFEATYRQSEFFTQYIRTFLPPIYLIRMQRLSRKLGNDLVPLWAWESQNLAKEAGIDEKIGDFGYFLGGDRSPALIGASSKLSEVYRSAYLRVLAWLRVRDAIDDKTFIGLSFFTVPADISMLSISPGTPPKWWPTGILGAESEPRVDLASVAAVSDLAGKDLERNWVVFAAEGAVLENSTSEFASMHFTLLPFGYRITGAELPDAREVFDVINACEAQTVNTTLSVFDEQKHAFIMPPHNFAFEGLVVLPMFARLKDDSQNVWNWFRGYHEPFLLCPPALPPTYGLRYDSSGWFMETPQKTIAAGQDWRVGSLERLDDVFFPQHGQYLSVSREWLDESTSHHDVRVAWVNRISYTYRKQSYEKPKHYTQTSFVQLGAVITSRLLTPASD